MGADTTKISIIQKVMDDAMTVVVVDENENRDKVYVNPDKYHSREPLP